MYLDRDTSRNVPARDTLRHVIKAWCKVAWLKAGILTFVNERSKTKNMQPEAVRKRFRRLTNEEIQQLVEAKDSENTRGGSTPIHYLYGYVPPNGVVILKLLI